MGNEFRGYSFMYTNKVVNREGSKRILVRGQVNFEGPVPKLLLVKNFCDGGPC